MKRVNIIERTNELIKIFSHKSIKTHHYKAAQRGHERAFFLLDVEDQQRALADKKADDEAAEKIRAETVPSDGVSGQLVW